MDRNGKSAIQIARKFGVRQKNVAGEHFRARAVEFNKSSEATFGAGTCNAFAVCKTKSNDHIGVDQRIWVLVEVVNGE